MKSENTAVFPLDTTNSLEDSTSTIVVSRQAWNLQSFPDFFFSVKSMEARALETSADSQNDDTSFSQKHLKIGEEEKGRPYFNNRKNNTTYLWYFSRVGNCCMNKVQTQK